MPRAKSNNCVDCGRSIWNHSTRCRGCATSLGNTARIDAKGPPYIPNEDTGCWEWQRSKTHQGYGLLQGRMAHRVIYEKAKGVVPPGMHLDHLCRNRGCVNPDHLEPVTPSENAHRGAKCKLTPENVRAIRVLLASGESTGAIAEKFDVTFGAVWFIKTGKNWRDVH